ncbi:terminase family protein, partial [bacterium]|nr:terminase family protein [bacterium]
MTASEFKLLQRAARSPWSFMAGFVKTLDPKRGVCGFPEYSYVRELVSATHRNRFLLVPKSRQMFVTWTMLAFFLWRALFRGPGLYLFLSRNERCAEELVGRVRFMIDNLPDFLKPKLTANSKQEIALGTLGSRICSLPATPDGPRMYSPSGVFWDEMAFTPYDRQIWSALQPALMSGGRFVGVSSSGGARNYFAEIAQATPPNPPVNGGEYESPPVYGGTKGGSESCGEEPESPSASSGGTEGGSLFHIHRVHYSMHPERSGDSYKETAGKGLSDAQWKREQEISFESQDDLVYSEFDPVLHILSEHWRANPEWEIYRSIDFGYRSPFVLWLQRTPADEFIVFDEWAGHDSTTSEMLEVIRRIDASHGINEGDTMWTSCDPAGAAMQDSGLSPVDLLRRHSLKLCYRSSRIMPGVEAVKA